MPYKKAYIISLGGSLIIPQSGLDYKFLKEFRTLIINQIKKGNKFFIVTGGGDTARKYIQGAEKITNVKNEDCDWLGIHATRLNAHLIRTIFRQIAHPEIITNPTVKLKQPFNNKLSNLIIASGFRPGNSSDYVATLLAEKYKIKTVINLSNIDYVYNKDPKKFKDAVKLKEINWNNFRKIVGNKWSPGLSGPFDPIASKKAEKLELTVAIMNGKNLKNLQNYLEGKTFKGTIIQ